MEIWEPKIPGTLWATPGLLRTALPLPFILYCKKSYLKFFVQATLEERVKMVLVLVTIAVRTHNFSCRINVPFL